MERYEPGRVDDNDVRLINNAGDFFAAEHEHRV